MRDNIIEDKSLNFAVRVVKLCEYLKKKKRETVISRQILRSGTSIGANIKEAKCGQSRKDFISKLSIALKEASETEYWLLLLYRTNYLSERQFSHIMTDCQELIKLLVAIIKSTKDKKIINY